MNTEELARLLARKGHTPRKLVYGASWIIGVTLLTIGLLLDLSGFWTSRPYSVNIFSGLTAFFFGLPLVLFILNQTRDRLDTLSESFAREIALYEQQTAHMVWIDTATVAVLDAEHFTLLQDRAFNDQLCKLAWSPSECGVLQGVAVCQTGLGDGYYPLSKHESIPGRVDRIELAFDPDDQSSSSPILFGTIDVTSGVLNITDPCHAFSQRPAPRTVPVPEGKWLVSVVYVNDRSSGDRRVGALIVELEPTDSLPVVTNASV